MLLRALWLNITKYREVGVTPKRGRALRCKSSRRTSAVGFSLQSLTQKPTTFKI